MQLGEEPSISQVANRFIGTGLFSAPLPGKLNRPLLSAMLAAGVPFTSTDTVSKLLPQERAGTKSFLLLIRCSTEPGYRSRWRIDSRAVSARSFMPLWFGVSTPCTERSRQETAAVARRRKSRDPGLYQRLAHLRSRTRTLGITSK